MKPQFLQHEHVAGSTRVTCAPEQCFSQSDRLHGGAFGHVCRGGAGEQPGPGGAVQLPEGTKALRVLSFGGGPCHHGPLRNLRHFTHHSGRVRKRTKMAGRETFVQLRLLHDDLRWIGDHLHSSLHGHGPIPGLKQAVLLQRAREPSSWPASP